MTVSRADTTFSRMSLLPGRTTPFFGMFALAVALPTAAAQQSRLRVEWNENAPQYRGQTARRVTVICPPGGTPSAVYGTGVYADNSSVCGAATHAGVIGTTSGGVVNLVIAAGMSAYQGSTQNGVTSQQSGPFAGSFSVERDNGQGRIDWATTAAGIALAGSPLTLVCPPGDVKRVWGTDVYTEDSSICTAAAHAGLITPGAGGAVTIAGAGPQDRFAASDRNGVASLEWKAWPASFRVSAASTSRLSGTTLRQPKTTAPGTSAPGVMVSPANGLVTTEAGGTATFTVRLNAPPSTDVVIPLATSSTKEGSIAPTSLTFTPANWMTAQTVTVRGVDDAVADGDQPYFIRTLPIQASGDSAYDNFNAIDVSVTNSDDDLAAVLVRPISGISTTEAGGTATFVIVLRSQPTGAVTVNLSSSKPAEGTVSPATVSFDATNWSTPQSITVRGVDDSAADGDAGYSIVTSDAASTDPKYNGLVVDDVSLTNRDND